MDLITRERALRNLGGLSPTAEDALLIDALVGAVSQPAGNYCRRDFTVREYDELYDGVRGNRLLLRQYPLLAVSRVAYGPTTVLRVTNTSSTNQRATVRVT